jgi:hypothetical protein
MSEPATLHPAAPVIEVEVRTNACIVPGCGGAVVRHSLGGGQAVDRCVRCFRRYRLAPASAPEHEPSKLRRFIDDFVSWRE